jgi:hypothetical protein
VQLQRCARQRSGVVGHAAPRHLLAVGLHPLRRVYGLRACSIVTTAWFRALLWSRSLFDLCSAELAWFLSLDSRVERVYMILVFMGMSSDTLGRQSLGGSAEAEAAQHTPPVTAQGAWSVRRPPDPSSCSSRNLGRRHAP